MNNKVLPQTVWISVGCRPFTDTVVVKFLRSDKKDFDIECEGNYPLNQFPVAKLDKECILSMINYLQEVLNDK